MKKGLSEYKFGRLAVEALRNALRLHFDSVVLFKNRSYPSAFQLSVLALEEFAKASWVDHYYFYARGSGFPDPTFEQSWLELLYRHPEKQRAFFGRDRHDFSPTFVDFVHRNELELMKQRATYVGLNRVKGKVDVASRISTPRSITAKDARQIISLINATFIEVHRLITLQGDYFAFPAWTELSGEPP